MTVKPLPCVIAALVAAPFSAVAFAQPPETPMTRRSGVDGLIGLISDASSYGTRAVDGVTVRAFAIGTYAWNMGDRPMEWVSGTNQHALISQNVYRATGNRFEQVGASWVKHVAVAANSTFNASFGSCVTQGIGGSSRLGVNCHDLYGSGLNAAQGRLGPRYDVDPTTGAFTFPFAQMVPPLVSGDNVARRVLMRDSDVQPASNPGAVYYTDTALYSFDDAAWGNGRNNFSSRRFAAFPAWSAGQQNLTFDGASYRTSSLEHWAWATPGVRLSRVDTFERSGTVVDKWVPYAQGNTSSTMLPSAQWVTLAKELWTRYVASSAASDNGDGTWTYDVAILNMNSHRAGTGFAVHLPAGAVVTSVSSHEPLYHSGDRVRNVPWLISNTRGKLAWSADPATESATLPTVGQVTLAPNAILFSAVHSFRFTVNRPPALGSGQLSFWRPPTDATGEQGGAVAITDMTLPSYCKADVGSTGGQTGPDGVLDNNDLVAFIDAFFNGDRFNADLGGTGGLAGPDNALNNNDFVVFIDAFFAGCA